MAKLLKTNVSQAISDFNDVKLALEERNIEVGAKPTSEYGNLVRSIQGGGAIITDATELFKNGVRLDAMRELLAMCQGTTSFQGTFYNCDDLDELDLSQLDTSHATSMKEFLYGCGSLEHLDLSTFDTGKVTSFYRMFYNCHSLNDLDISGLSTESATTLEAMFCLCKAMKSLDLKHFDVSNVAAIASMFDYCENLESIDMSGWNTSKVTSMSTVFSRCSNLKTLDLSHFDVSNVTSMGNMFQYCNKLKSIGDLSGWDTRKVTTMSYMFFNCTALEEIVGFSAANSAGIGITLPTGTANSPAALRRLTFRTYEDGTPAIRSAINIQHCSFDREGMVEMFNTLPDVSGMSHSASHKKITITGNPCLFSEIALPEYSAGIQFDDYESFCTEVAARYRGFDHQNAPLEYCVGDVRYNPFVAGTFSDITEATFENGSVVVRFLADTIVIPEEDRLSDADRAIATNKGWTLVE